VGAGPAEARLDLVGDAEAAGRADVGVGVLQVAVGIDDGPADALDRLGDEAGELPESRTGSGS
jgi:hypothetical protein